MARKKKTTAEKEQKKTPTKFAAIAKGTEPWKVLDALMDEMIRDNPERFGHLENCKLRLFWAKDWKADPDGIAVGAQVCKASEIDRILVEAGQGKGESPDIFIKLPKTTWPKLNLDEKQHRLFHELCHIRPALDAKGEQKTDALDRLLWRLGRHPIAAFPEEVARFGVERILEHNAIIAKQIEEADRPLLAAMEKGDKAGEPESASSKDAWRRWGIAKLELPPLIEDYIVAAEFKTMGKLSDFMDEGKDFWAANLKVGGKAKPPNFKDRVEACWRDFWKAHPEFWEA